MVNTRLGAGQINPFVSQLNQVPSSTTRISDGSHDVVVLYGTDAVNSEPHTIKNLQAQQNQPPQQDPHHLHHQ
jgi:hypothetical protein